MTDPIEATEHLTAPELWEYYAGILDKIASGLATVPTEDYRDQGRALIHLANDLRGDAETFREELGVAS